MITQVGPSLWRGPRPLNFSDLVSRGIKTDLNLEVGWFEWFHGESKQEQDRADAAGVLYVHSPISDFCFPSQFVLDGILQAISQLGPVYVHCRHGNDRTGIVCAAYRVKMQGWTVDAAITEMYAMGFHKFPYAYLGWVKALREYCAWVPRKPL